jgi:glucosamine--fructose-6-phosphate aminotransferase (isomerizing)
MATSSLLIRLATASRATQRQAFQVRAISAITSSQQSTNHFETASFSSKYGVLAAATATLAATGVVNENKESSKCCGIVGVVGATKGDARDFLIEGLTILKNRGYDSAGIATMDDKNPSLVSIFSFGCNHRSGIHH